MPLLQLDDVDLYYEVHGSGRPFLFCAATCTWGEVWRPHQVPEFARDHRVVIFDQRGTGRSRVRSADFSTARLAADAAALLAHLDARDAIVLGHSNGGRVAQLLALDHPGRVSALILASSGGAPPRPITGVPIDMCVELVEKGYARAIAESSAETGFTAQFRTGHRDQVERFMAIKMGDLPPVRIYLGHVLGKNGFAPGDRLRSLACPTLVLIGDDEDHSAGSGATHLAYAQSLARDIPGARLVVLEGQGHYYFYSAPEETNRAIREFLVQTGAPKA